MLRCSDNSLYTGVTTNIERRITEHNECNKRGAKYTRVRRPVKLAYSLACESRSKASQQEYQLKQLTKQQKEKLVSDYLAQFTIKINTAVS